MSQDQKKKKKRHSRPLSVGPALPLQVPPPCHLLCLSQPTKPTLFPDDSVSLSRPRGLPSLAASATVTHLTDGKPPYLWSLACAISPIELRDNFCPLLPLAPLLPPFCSSREQHPLFSEGIAVMKARSTLQALAVMFRFKPCPSGAVTSHTERWLNKPEHLLCLYPTSHGWQACGNAEGSVLCLPGAEVFDRHVH